MKKQEKLTQIIENDNENILEILNEALSDLENLNEVSSLNEIQKNAFVIENDFYNDVNANQNFSYLYDNSFDEDEEDWIDEEINYLENKYLGFKRNEKKILIH